MKLRLKLILAGALIAAASPSFAADLAPAPMEPMAPVVLPFTWSGFYIGADVGYSWSSVDNEFPGSGIAGTSPDSDGVVGGLYAGYNAQFNQIVVGLEADIEASSNSGDDTFLGAFSSADKNWQGSVRARLGYAIDNFMPYITGGVAFSDWDFEAGPAIGPVSSYSDTFVGWTAGVGVDYAFTPNLIGRVEYRYTDFGDNSNGIGAFGVPVTSKNDLTDNTVRVGIAYKF